MMKKIICLLIMAALCFTAMPVMASDGSDLMEQAKSLPDDGQNPVMNFIGNYVCDRARAEVMPKGDESAQITITWGSSAFDTAQWTMSGVLDTDTLEVSYSDCTKKIISYDRDSEETDQTPEETVEYTDGSGKIIFGEDGTLTWDDSQEHIADDMVFEYIVIVDPAEADPDEVTQEQVEENVIGSWIIAERDGQPALTNEKVVFTFLSPTEARLSASLNSHPEGSPWVDLVEADVDITGNMMIVTWSADEGTIIEDDISISNITDTEQQGDLIVKMIEDDVEMILMEEPICLVKISEDYSKDIIGTWEGHSTSGTSASDDGQEHRWEYKDDGTYVYYVKDGDNWIPGDDTLNEYFVAGNLLCTRWIEGEKEYREWWEITIEDDTMNWTALREDEDGDTFTAEFEMKRVKEQIKSDEKNDE